MMVMVTSAHVFEADFGEVGFPKCCVKAELAKAARFADFGVFHHSQRVSSFKQYVCGLRV